MADMAYRVVACPHDYFPGFPERSMSRVEMLDGDQVVGFADYFVGNGWSVFPLFTVAESHRTEQQVFGFIANVYNLIGSTKTFWWSTPPTMEKYFDMIVEARPDIMFAASGSINRVANRQP